MATSVYMYIYTHTRKSVVLRYLTHQNSQPPIQKIALNYVCIHFSCVLRPSNLLIIIIVHVKQQFFVFTAALRTAVYRVVPTRGRETSRIFFRRLKFFATIDSIKTTAVHSAQRGKRFCDGEKKPPPCGCSAVYAFCVRVGRIKKRNAKNSIVFLLRRILGTTN